MDAPFASLILLPGLGDRPLCFFKEIYTCSTFLLLLPAVLNLRGLVEGCEALEADRLCSFAFSGLEARRFGRRPALGKLRTQGGMNTRPELCVLIVPRLFCIAILQPFQKLVFLSMAMRF